MLVMAALLLGVVVFMGFAMFDFNQRVYYRQNLNQQENVQQLAVQGRLLVEQRLAGYLDTLHAVAELLPKDEPLISEKNMSSLRHIVKGLDFERLALAGTDGVMVTTASINCDVSDRPYYQQALRGQSVISGVEHSRISSDQVFVVAVPVYASDGKVRGMSQGALRVDRFDPYQGTRLEKNAYVRVVDQEGRYIIGASEEDREILNGRSLFEDLAVLEPTLPLEQTGASMESRQPCLLTTDGYDLYLEPMSLNGWYIVTALDHDEVESSIHAFLGSDLQILIVKFTLAAIVLCVSIAGWLWSEEKEHARAESALRTRLMADTLGYLVVDLERDTILDGTERLIAPCTKEMSFARIIDVTIDRAVPAEYRADLRLRLDPADILRRFRGGQKEDVVEYPINSRTGQTAWRQCSIHVHEEQPDLHKAYLTFRSITEKKRTELDLQKEAERDFLTGLYNRRRGRELIVQRLGKLESGAHYAFMILDLDNFKSLNDRLGHQTGDRALQEVAGVLQRHFRQEDIVVRLGGDEFLVFFRSPDERDRLEHRLSSLMEKLVLTYSGEGGPVTVTASAGVVLAPDHGSDIAELYPKADALLYSVKNSGKSDYRIAP